MGSVGVFLFLRGLLAAKYGVGTVSLTLYDHQAVLALAYFSMYCFRFSGRVTEEVARVAVQALSAVHACNLLDGDVEARNIMVVRAIEPSECQSARRVDRKERAYQVLILSNRLRCAE
jgi:hypothetical protein